MLTLGAKRRNEKKWRVFFSFSFFHSLLREKKREKRIKNKKQQKKQQMASDDERRVQQQLQAELQVAYMQEFYSVRCW